MNLLLSMFARNGYLPHGYCFTWTPGLLWTMVAADLLIAASYFAIPLALVSYVRQRGATPANWIVLLFGAFILACGTTHLMDVWTIWSPDYALQALTKLVTAGISMVTAVALARLVPRALRLPTVEKLQTTVAQLEREVKARHTAEESLRDAQDALAVTLASIGAGFIAIDAQGRVTRLNAIAHSLLGWSEDEARGQVLWRVLVSKGRPAADLALNPVDVYLRDRMTIDSILDADVVARDGTIVPMQVKAGLTRDEHGAPRSIAIVLRDLRPELAAQAASGRLQAIVDSSGDAIIGKDLSGSITSWNGGAEALFGYAAHEVVGRPIHLLIPPERQDEEDDILARVRRGDPVHHLETVRRRKDGTLVDIVATISPVLDARGRVVGASKIARDFTERRKSELDLLTQLQRLRLLDQITRAIGERLDLASVYQVAVRSLSDDLPSDLGCVLTHDDRSDSLLLASLSERAGTPFMAAAELVAVAGSGLSRCLKGELLHEPDLAAVDLPLPQRLVAAGYRSMVAAPLQSEEQIFGVLLTARRAPDAFSSAECEFIRQLSSHVALASRQARLHGQLQAAFDELSRSQQSAVQQERLRALGQMASGIAHDINNALSPAVLYAESLLEHETLGERAREQVRRIAQAIEDVAATVARLREFYRSGEPQLNLQPISINALVQRVVELTQARWRDMPQERGVVIDVVTALEPRQPAVWVIESEVRDALVNLVFNAIDAMPQGGTMTLRTRLLAASEVDIDGSALPPRVAVDVTDTGVGMDEHTRLRCLEPFFTTKGDRGTGLGLAMVYGAAKRHGAEIRIQSQPGLGSTFTVLFPVGALPLGRPATDAPAPALAAPIRILLVDDDPALLRSLRHTLEADGHHVEAADGGQVGIGMFVRATHAGHPYDLVITDLGMPHVDGRSVAAAVRRLSPITPVVMLTGWGQRMAEDGEKPPGVDCVLSKPPKLADLRLAIGRVKDKPVRPGSLA